MKIDSSIKEMCYEESSHGVLVRSQERSDAYGEVFTPTELVIKLLEELPNEMWEAGKTFLDPACGNGQFLAAVAIVKKELGHGSVLGSIYGVDLMEDNVAECRERLLAIVGDTAENRKTVEQNILCRNGLEYEYGFGTSPTEKFFDDW